VFAASAGRVRGFMSYAAAAVREGLRYEAGSYRIEAEGLPGAEFRAFLVTVANSRQWGNGALIAPNALLDDDRLDMVVIPESSPLSLVANAWRLFAGSMADWPGVRMHQVRTATITATPPAPVHIDGEPIGRLSTIEVRVRRAALRVRVPISRIPEPESRV
jgi:diacylglycerol kinase (ATP)